MSRKPEVVFCASEEEWHEKRKHLIGASDVPALLGISKWKSPRMLWEEKHIGGTSPIEETEAMQAGKFMELAIAPWYSARTQRTVLTPQEFYGAPPGTYAVIVMHPERMLGCTPDRIVLHPDTKEPGILQLKNADRFTLDEWTGIDTDEVAPPAQYQAQVMAEMLCCGLSWGSIAVSIGGNRLRWADMAPWEPMERTIESEVAKFWGSRTAPAPIALDLEGIRSKHQRIHGLSKELEHPEVLMEYALECSRAAFHEKRASDLKARLAEDVGPAETITIGGQVVATWKTSERNESARPARTTIVSRLTLSASIKKQAEAQVQAALLP